MIKNKFGIMTLLMLLASSYLGVIGFGIIFVGLAICFGVLSLSRDGKVGKFLTVLGVLIFIALVFGSQYIYKNVYHIKEEPYYQKQ